MELIHNTIGMLLIFFVVIGNTHWLYTLASHTVLGQSKLALALALALGLALGLGLGLGHAFWKTPMEHILDKR